MESSSLETNDVVRVASDDELCLTIRAHALDIEILVSPTDDVHQVKEMQLAVLLGRDPSVYKYFTIQIGGVEIERNTTFFDNGIEVFSSRSISEI